VTDDLERRYRRLLLAYPRSYRRERGDEVIGTLLDAARPEQLRPTRREIGNLIGNGLRRRFMPAPGALPHVAAALVALVFAAVGVASGTWLGWRLDSPPLPSNSEAIAIARQAAPDYQPLTGPDRFDVLFDYDLDGQGGKPDSLTFPVNLILGGDDYHHGWVDVTYQRSAPSAAADIAAIRDRLAAAGWRVWPIHTSTTGDPARPEIAFYAQRGEHVLNVTTGAINPTTEQVREEWERTNPGGQSADRTFVLSFSRSEPAAVIGMGQAFGLAGLLIGWVIAARISRVARRRGMRVRLAHLGLTTLGLTLTLAPNALLGPGFLLWSLFDLRFGAGPTPTPYWAFYVQFPVSLAYSVGVLALLAACVLLALRRRPAGAAEAADRIPAWLTTVVIMSAPLAAVVLACTAMSAVSAVAAALGL
jgi:hypothetical protein